MVLKNKKELKILKNSAKPYKDVPRENTLTDKNSDIPKLECEDSSNSDMLSKNIKIDEELLFKIFKEEVYEKIIKNNKVTSQSVSMDNINGTSEQPEQQHEQSEHEQSEHEQSEHEQPEQQQQSEHEQHIKTKDPELNCETENIEQESYIEDARQEAEKEAEREAASQVNKQQMNNPINMPLNEYIEAARQEVEKEAEKEAEKQAKTIVR